MVKNLLSSNFPNDLTFFKVCPLTVPSQSSSSSPSLFLSSHILFDLSLYHLSIVDFRFPLLLKILPTHTYPLLLNIRMILMLAQQALLYLFNDFFMMVGYFSALSSCFPSFHFSAPLFFLANHLLHPFVKIHHHQHESNN
jgi:hypothetical protein